MWNRSASRQRTNPDAGLSQRLADLTRQLRQALGARPLPRLQTDSHDSTGELVQLTNGLIEALERAEARAEAAVRDRAELDQSMAELEARFEDEVLAHQRTSRELERQRGVLRQVMETLPYCMFWRDRNGVYLGANNNKLRALGLASMDQLIGKSTREICLTREEADFFLEVDRQVMESGQPIFNLEEVQQRPDGPHTLLVSKVPLHDDTGAVTGVLGMYVDVTDRRALDGQAAEELSAAFARGSNGARNIARR